MNTILEIDAGPFAPALGYITALIAFSSALWALLWRSTGVWETPKETIPKAARGTILVVLGIGIVLLWLNITPEKIDYYTHISIIGGIILIITFIFYHPFTRAYTFEKEIVTGENEVGVQKIIGGLVLTPQAKKTIKEKGISIQIYYKGTSYDERAVWTNGSLQLAKAIISVLYLVCIVSGVLAITTAGFMIQVKLTNKPAYSIIKSSDSPGLKKN